jgi:integrase
MAKRKIFTKTDISVPQVEHGHDAAGNVFILPEAIPPKNTTTKFGRNTSHSLSFDFTRWYGIGIDPITYACQRQIERFLAGQEGALQPTTVVGYCVNGLRFFLDYCSLRRIAYGRELTLTDVHRDMIDGYLGYLAGMGSAVNTQKGRYAHIKSILIALGRRSLISVVPSGDNATFPRNPFPKSNRKAKGETALSKRERQAFTVALRQAIKPLWAENVDVNSELLSYAFLVVALHTGRNTTPLMEMSRDCLRAHPKNNTAFLVLWKRRGYNSSKVALRVMSDAERLLESTPSVRTNVESLIRRVIDLTAPIEAEVPDYLKNRVWLCHSSDTKGIGRFKPLSAAMLTSATNRLVAQYDLCDSDGKPLRITVSRLRKTFANRIFDLTDGDLSITAAALGSTLQVTDRNYLAPSEDARRNWQFMGELLVKELVNRTIGATYKDTPMGRCVDPVNGQYAPKREGATCMSFLNCLRCKHYVVTAEDLYKLYSFYFRVLDERSRMNTHRWKREYAHIPRLIDHYIVDEGLRRGTFNAAAVVAAREHARTLPHPFWSVDLIDSMELFA